MILSQLLERLPSPQKSLTRLQGAHVGFEFEVIIPTDSPLYVGAAEHRATMSVVDLSDVGDVADAFDLDPTEKRKITRIYDRMFDDAKTDWINDNDIYDDEDPVEEFERKFGSRDDFNTLMDIKGVDIMDIIQELDVEPTHGWASRSTRIARDNIFYTEPADGELQRTHEELADAISRHFGVKAASLSTPNHSMWSVVEDGSIAHIHDFVGAEVVTPPIPIEEAADTVTEFFDFANNNGLLTNESTGLHINVSVGDMSKLDPLKFIVFLGETHALRVFRRLNNYNAKSHTDTLSLTLRNRVTSIPNNPEALRGIVYDALAKEKYTSVNLTKLKDGFMEVRIAGGNYLEHDVKVQDFLKRITVALHVASNPSAQRSEYIKKLTKLFQLGFDAAAAKKLQGLDDVIILPNDQKNMETLNDPSATREQKLEAASYIIDLLWKTKVMVSIGVIRDLLAVLRKQGIRLSDLATSDENRSKLADLKLPIK